MKINFIDYVKIYCASGNGGSGLVHFYRGKFINKGGPDGGNGGKGGDIIIKGNNQLWTLLSFRYMKNIKAKDGQRGGINCMSGMNGSNIILEVPIGSVIKNENQEIIFEIINHGEEKILMHGGKGGLGNFFFRSSTNRTPYYAQPGCLGLQGYIIIELKILADVGLVGLPNVGKSTLLSVISSNKKPKIANYPFTTIVPNLGVVFYDNYSFIMADIPGIIQGASIGKGLGYQFLRHIERSTVLLFIISGDSYNHVKDYQILCKELESYNLNMLHKKKIIGISKSDLLNNTSKETIQDNFFNTKIIFFSSLNQEGLMHLKNELFLLLN